MNKKFIFLLSFFLVFSLHASCSAPQFETLESVKLSDEELKRLMAVRLATSASIHLPVQEFEWFSVGLDGNLVFTNADRKFSGVIAYETPSVVNFYQEDVTPYDFYKNIFLSPSGVYCEYLDSYKIEEQAYRLKIQLKDGVVFAFGRDGENRFYILNNKKPDVVVSGLIRTINIDFVKKILNSIDLKG